MPRDASDADLARLIAASGADARAAESALFQRYAPRIKLYGRKYLKSEAGAEDLVQHVMLRVLEAIRAARVAELDRLSSFIFGTCRHVCWDTRRAEQRQRKVERATEQLATDIAPPEHSERDVVQLFRCMAALPEREARILRMSFMEDQAAENIAERLGLSSGNVRVIRHRALAKLAACLGVEEKS